MHLDSDFQNRIVDALKSAGWEAAAERVARAQVTHGFSDEELQELARQAMGRLCRDREAARVFASLDSFDQDVYLRAAFLGDPLPRPVKIS